MKQATMSRDLWESLEYRRWEHSERIEARDRHTRSLDSLRKLPLNTRKKLARKRSLDRLHFQAQIEAKRRRGAIE